MSLRSWRASRRTCVVEAAFLRDVASWTWWVTLTFFRSVPRDRARVALRFWLRGVAREVGDHVKVAWVLEPTRVGVPHAHVLVAVPDGKSMGQNGAEALWRRSDPLAGFSRVVRYAPGRGCDPRFGAAGYLAEKQDWNVTVACPRRPPCRRKGGCLVLRGPWFS
jgi:hypothetical protein